MGQPVEVRVLSRAVTLVAQATLKVYRQLPDVGSDRSCYFEPAFLLAAQRAFISWESFLRPAGVSWPFLLAGLLAGAAATPAPRLLAQRARAAAASFALVAGEKKRPAAVGAVGAVGL